MNILFVNSTVKWGGVKTWMLEYGTKLASREHKVIICANKKETGSFIGRCKENELTVYPMKFGVDYSPFTIWRFISIIQKEKIDIVCTNIEKDNRSAGIAAKILGKKVFQRVGSVNDLSDRLKVRLVQKHVVDKIIVPCQDIKRGLKRFKWLDEDKVSVIYNGKDLRKYQPGKFNAAVRKELGISPDTLLVGVVSRLVAGKGHSCLLDSFFSLAKRFCNIKLVIVGDGKERSALEKIALSKGREDRVIFLGHRNDVERIIDALDIAVFPSFDEGFPNTVVEYMAMGKPVVATDVGGIPELVVDGETGLLLPPADSEKLAEALGRLIEDKEEREKMGSNGRKRVEEFFNIEDKVSELEKFLRHE